MPKRILLNVMTVNQVVAYNLARAREHRGWTQDEAAAHLERYLGYRWSKAVFSAAERSVDGRRMREFNGNELVAFALAFDLPLGWFLIPPPSAEAILTSDPRPPTYSDDGRLVDDGHVNVADCSVDQLLRLSRMYVPPGTLEGGAPTQPDAMLEVLTEVARELRGYAERLDRRVLTDAATPDPPHTTEKS
jgi:hypothetical protein